MKKKILSIAIILILIASLILLTGCGNKESDSSNLNETNQDTENEQEEIQNDYSKYADTFSSKIISAQLSYYAIEDIDGDEIPELLGKNENEAEPNFKLYKLENENLKEISDSSSETAFNGIKEISKNDNGVSIINSFGTNYNTNGMIIDFAYINDGKYVEYSKMVGLDLDTLSSSKVYKKEINFNTLEITTKEYEFTINSSASSMDNAIVSEEYEKEISKIKQEIGSNVQNIEFHENTFSEWEHDDTELKEQVRNLLNKTTTHKSGNNNNTTESEQGSLNLENFEKVMQEYGINVKQLGQDSVKVSYLGDDRNAHNTTYNFDVYNSEEKALNYWNSFKNYTYANYDDVKNEKKEISLEENEHSDKIEYHLSNGLHIEFRENEYYLSVYISEDAGNEGIAFAREVLSKLGYHVKSTTFINNN